MAFSTEDTIVAMATPAGRGGIGVVRISGPAARAVAAPLIGALDLEPRRATFVRVHAVDIQDESIVTWFPGPRSYTGEDVVELSLHGSPVLLRAVIEAALRAGARLAEPGEFTLRAYLSGRLDLVQAEAVRDLIDAVTPLQARTAFDQLDGTLTGAIGEIDRTLFELSARLEASLDFPDEGYHFITHAETANSIGGLIEQVDRLLAGAKAGRLVREGARVVLVGRPNAGKSTLFNALAGASRAIVTAVPGTTRDLLTEVMDVKGLAITLVDTAGLRDGMLDPVESEGMSRARAAAAGADLQLVVLDRSAPLTADDMRLLSASDRVARVVVASKADLPPAWTSVDGESVIAVAAVDGDGLDELRHAIAAALGVSDVYKDTPALTNVRHVHLLETARLALARAREAAAAAAPEELVAADLAEARATIEEITGRRTADDTLKAIFERFCIGK